MKKNKLTIAAVCASSIAFSGLAGEKPQVPSQQEIQVEDNIPVVLTSTVTGVEVSSMSGGQQMFVYSVETENGEVFKTMPTSIPKSVGDDSVIMINQKIFTSLTKVVVLNYDNPGGQVLVQLIN